MAVKYDKLFAVLKERNMKDVRKRVSEGQTLKILPATHNGRFCLITPMAQRKSR